MTHRLGSLIVSQYVPGEAQHIDPVSELRWEDLILIEIPTDRGAP